jgi:hypothetical protein
LSKGAGVGGGKGPKTTSDEQDDTVQNTPKFTPEDKVEATDESPLRNEPGSNRSRR